MLKFRPTMPKALNYVDEISAFELFLSTEKLYGEKYIHFTTSLPYLGAVKKKLSNQLGVVRIEVFKNEWSGSSAIEFNQTKLQIQ